MIITHSPAHSSPSSHTLSLTLTLTPFLTLRHSLGVGKDMVGFPTALDTRPRLILLVHIPSLLASAVRIHTVAGDSDIRVDTDGDALQSNRQRASPAAAAFAARHRARREWLGRRGRPGLGRRGATLKLSLAEAQAEAALNDQRQQLSGAPARQLAGSHSQQKPQASQWRDYHLPIERSLARARRYVLGEWWDRRRDFCGGAEERAEAPRSRAAGQGRAGAGVEGARP